MCEVGNNAFFAIYWRNQVRKCTEVSEHSVLQSFRKHRAMVAACNYRSCDFFSALLCFLPFVRQVAVHGVTSRARDRSLSGSLSLSHLLSCKPLWLSHSQPMCNFCMLLSLHLQCLPLPGPHFCDGI